MIHSITYVDACEFKVLLILSKSLSGLLQYFKFEDDKMNGSQDMRATLRQGELSGLMRWMGQKVTFYIVNITVLFWHCRGSAAVANFTALYFKHTGNEWQLIARLTLWMAVAPPGLRGGGTADQRLQERSELLYLHTSTSSFNHLLANSLSLTLRESERVSSKSDCPFICWSKDKESEGGGGGQQWIYIGTRRISKERKRNQYGESSTEGRDGEKKRWYFLNPCE